MNEAETRAELIDPALTAVGWGVVEGSRVAREFQITAGRLEGSGRRGKADKADYVLVFRGKRLAVIEAKKRDAHVTEGLGQAKAYAEKLQIRFTFSTNGLGVYKVDMATGAEGDPTGTVPEVVSRRFDEAGRNLRDDSGVGDTSGSRDP